MRDDGGSGRSIVGVTANMVAMKMRADQMVYRAAGKRFGCRYSDRRRFLQTVVDQDGAFIVDQHSQRSAGVSAIHL